MIVLKGSLSGLVYLLFTTYVSEIFRLSYVVKTTFEFICFHIVSIISEIYFIKEQEKYLSSMENNEKRI
ncbi:hypothetical protein OXPF_23990 [Oxobacter pfennigii]|uniref:Uncharacterized protein n=1 Tax=Oxobacter pfennigii TaxID=36849 RepID=A0A0P8WNU8_9CLOT|nr:hypothetical protein OXPF_23990 [Oxobacter pfennigii]